jgi:hypothetical protein
MIAVLVVILLVSALYLLLRRRTPVDTSVQPSSPLEVSLAPADVALQSRLGLNAKSKPITITVSQVRQFMFILRCV